MLGAVLERRRSAWDVVLGILLVLVGAVILAHAVLATAVSVVLLGWLALTGRVITLVAAVLQIGRGGFWAAALSGGLLVVLGLMVLRNPGAAAPLAQRCCSTAWCRWCWVCWCCSTSSPPR